MKHLSVAWQHIRRSPYQAFSTILVMTLTFFLGATFVLLAIGSQGVLSWFETRPQVTAFFKDGTKAEQVETLKDKLSQAGKVKEMKYISKEEALEIYREQSKNDPLLLEMVTASLLPASLEVSAKELSMLSDIADTLKNEPTVKEVIYQEDVISSLSSWTSALRKVGIGVLSFLAIISLLEILVIIGMKIALRKDEIEVLRLIGASSWYIRAPFIFEGIIYGVGGAIIAWILALILLLYSTPSLISYLGDVPILPLSPVVMGGLLGGVVLGGILIGAFGSYLAVKRYLR